MALWERTTAMSTLRRIHQKTLEDKGLWSEGTILILLDRLEKSFAKLERSHDTLAREATDGAELDAHMEFYQNAEIMMDKTVAELRCRLQQVLTQKPTGKMAQSPQIRLPELTIPVFDGSSENWLEFRDMFLSLVHEQPHLDPVCKLAYLKELVDATKVTQIAGVYTGGYEEIWSQLRKRYDRPRRLIEAHYTRLATLPDNPRESQESLHRVIDHFRQYIRAMNVLGQPIGQWDAPLFSILFTKLPSEAVAYYYRTNLEDEIPKVNDILLMLEDYAETVSPGESGEYSRRVHKVTVGPNSNGGVPSIYQPEENEVSEEQGVPSVTPSAQDVDEHLIVVEPQSHDKEHVVEAVRIPEYDPVLNMKEITWSPGWAPEKFPSPRTSSQQIVNELAGERYEQVPPDEVRQTAKNPGLRPAEEVNRGLGAPATNREEIDPSGSWSWAEDQDWKTRVVQSWPRQLRDSRERTGDEETTNMRQYEMNIARVWSDEYWTTKKVPGQRLESLGRTRCAVTWKAGWPPPLSIGCW